MKVLAVAANTMREAVRDRILYMLLFFALLMIGASKVISMLSAGTRPVTIVIDVGLASISFFSMLISIFMGIGLVSKEIERRTIHAVVSKPISREAFVLGKFLGMLATIALNEIVMVAFFASTLWLWGASFTREEAMALALQLVESALILALAIAFSGVASPMLASMFTLCSYFVGHWMDGLRLLIEKLPGAAERTVALALYRLLPNLELLNLKNQVVFPEPAVAASLPAQFRLGLLYGVCYTGAVLALAALAFRRKDFL
ncbi:MAG: ABC transporter permease [Acidobacteriota bacterium]